MMTSVSSGSLLLVAIAAGLLLCIAFQALLANLGIALGLTAAQWVIPGSDVDKSAVEASGPPSETEAMAKSLSTVAALGLCLTVDAAVFSACFLTVRLAAIPDSIAGATLGLVIWAAYFILLFWATTSWVGSSIEFVLGGVTSGLRQMMDLIGKIRNPSDNREQTNPDLGRPGWQEGRDNDTSDIRASQAFAKMHGQLIQSMEELRQDLKRDVQAAIDSPDERHQPNAKPGGQPEGVPCPSNLSNRSTASVAASDELAVGKHLRAVLGDRPSPSSPPSSTNVNPSSDLGQSMGLQQHLDKVLKVGKLASMDLPKLQQYAQLMYNSMTAIHRDTAKQAGDSEESSPAEVGGDEAIANATEQLCRYFKYTNRDKLTSDGLARKLDNILAPWTEPDVALASPPQFPLETFEDLLQQRSGIGPAKIQTLLQQIESAVQARQPSESGSAKAVPETLKRMLSEILPHGELSHLSPEHLQNLVWGIVQQTDRDEGTSASENSEPDHPQQPPENLGIVVEQVQQSLQSWMTQSGKIIRQLEEEWPHIIAAQPINLELLQHPLQAINQEVHGLSESLLQELEQARAWPESALQSIQGTISETQQQLNQQIQAMEAKLQAQTEQIKTAALQRAQQLRHLAAIAAWWLFLLSFSSGCAAATAGYVSAKFC